jgi:hypothetical protein
MTNIREIIGAQVHRKGVHLRAQEHKQGINRKKPKMKTQKSQYFPLFLLKLAAVIPFLLSTFFSLGHSFFTPNPFLLTKLSSK